MKPLGDDVDELARHHDDLARGFAAQVFLHLGARQCSGLDLRSGRFLFDEEPFTQFAVDLHGNLDFILDEQCLVVFRPDAPGEQSAAGGKLRFERLVEFFRQVRGKRI